MVLVHLLPKAGDIRDAGLISGLEDPVEEEMAPTLGFLPGKLHGQRSLVGCSLRSCKRVRHD